MNYEKSPESQVSPLLTQPNELALDAFISRSDRNLDPFVIFKLTKHNQQLIQNISELSKLANTDPLTGINNRRGLEQSFQELAGNGELAGVIQFDLIHFKDSANERFGHIKGDEVLQSFANILAQSTRDTDVVVRNIDSQESNKNVAVRTGGDEFVILVLKPDLLNGNARRDTTKQIDESDIEIIATRTKREFEQLTIVRDINYGQRKKNWLGVRFGYTVYYGQTLEQSLLQSDSK